MVTGSPRSDRVPTGCPLPRRKRGKEGKKRAAQRREAREKRKERKIGGGGAKK